VTDPVLQVENVSRLFDGRKAVDSVSFSVARGELHAIIGSNGAGKTTLFNLITGGLRVQHGRIIFKGGDITNHSPHRLCRLGIGRTFQINNIFARSTVRENIRLAIASYHRRSWNMTLDSRTLFNREIEEIASWVHLDAQLARYAAELPYGDRRRLELAIALAGRPELLLLDEPTCGVAVVERPALMQLVQDIIRKRGMTALLIEHDMDIVFSVADRVGVMHKGELIADDTPEAVYANAKVRSVYLGEPLIA
jgi:branched-chain amino acid transport system ATP-binding protein